MHCLRVQHFLKTFMKQKKMVKSVGVGYTSIHACENDCILFWREYEKSDCCPKCNVSRWKSEKKSLDGKRDYKVPRKVLRYFPIKKRLQRLFISSRTATLTRWHEEHRLKDGLLRHPADSPLWQDFDQKHSEFAADSRNIRLAFATDGFNPFSTMNVTYSIWPGILIPFNFPPSMCMKDSNFIMSVLIPGRSYVGSDMDVYFQPLVYGLLDMFVNGVRTYDSSKGEYFLLRAAILWTITDFPGLGSVSGFVTSGEAACPDCHSLICSLRLGNGSKSCYMGHRRFLHQEHPFRFDVDSFGGEIESRSAPVPLSGDEILEYTKNIKTVYGKNPSGKAAKNQRRKEGEPLVFLKRRPIWFILPYWKDLMVRHNFDAMHIEKNVCDNIINTLLNISGKSKDNLNARLDLQALGIRKDLHPVELDDNQFYLPPAPYSMSPAEKKTFCKVLKGVKFPDRYAADIQHNVLVSDKKIIGLNSHGSHILLQDLLPLVVRRVLPEVSAVLIRLSNFFKKLYLPVIRLSDMQRLQYKIAEILSLLETIFPPSFFTINVHLMVHLPVQARMAGPVHFRSMWPVERFLKKCKGYVRTKSHPEGSIMEGSMFDEALTLCSRYLQDDTNFNHRVRNKDRLQREISVTTPFFHNIGQALAGKCIVNLDYKTWLQAHRYVLFNYANIQPYLNKHASYLSSIGVRNKREINNMQYKTFHEWFRLHVEEMCEDASEEIKILAKRPMMMAHQYNSYTINGLNFHTQSYDENRSVQNCGVVLAAETTHFERGGDSFMNRY
ncbi:uncharacterized protein LOC112875826 isoform X2 [Panicum hallii]|uniref:uncharacterized protein LOC112875826 isoform X2 n=1 Tax=Panicum hallii TaxID=206008 RepID=UPI000DF4D6CA|nr:uncharacterized protein LOC112875826 isoform X2 [Panicum hallii]